MKAIPTSVKAQFFAMYLGQIFVSNGYPRKLERGITMSDASYGSNHLELRSVSDLTDEEIDIISQQYVGDKDFSMLSMSDKIDYREEIRPALQSCIKEGLMRNEIWGILLNFGILLPFTYLNEDKKPVTLSVDELIEMNWAQLTPKAK